MSECYRSSFCYLNATYLVAVMSVERNEERKKYMVVAKPSFYKYFRTMWKGGYMASDI